MKSELLFFQSGNIILIQILLEVQASTKKMPQKIRIWKKRNCPIIFFLMIHSVALKGCGGQRKFMFEEIRDFDLENLNPTALILETVRQTSVRQTVTKI